MSNRKLDVEHTQGAATVAPALVDAHDHDVINVSGHKQELERIFDPLSTISLAITSGNVWPSLAGSIVSHIINDLQIRSTYAWQTVAIYNGGPPGLIYEL